MAHANMPAPRRPLMRARPRAMKYDTTFCCLYEEDAHFAAFAVAETVPDRRLCHHAVTPRHAVATTSPHATAAYCAAAVVAPPPTSFVATFHATDQPRLFAAQRKKTQNAAQ